MALLDDIAGLVATNLTGAGMTRDATLIVVTPGTRNPALLSGGTNPIEIDYACKGLVITWKRALLNATTVQVGDRVVMLLGDKLQGQVPKVGDKVTIEGVTSRIVDIDRDPAAATYNCLTRA